jgi:hypothetical protein
MFTPLSITGHRVPPMRLNFGVSAVLSLSLFAACTDSPAPSDALNAPTDIRLTNSVSGGPTVNSVVNVTNDTTSQNETHWR